LLASRIVFPASLPVMQRCNGRAQTCFEDADYALHRDLLAEHCDTPDSGHSLCRLSLAKAKPNTGE